MLGKLAATPILAMIIIAACILYGGEPIGAQELPSVTPGATLAATPRANPSRTPAPIPTAALVVSASPTLASRESTVTEGEGGVVRIWRHLTSGGALTVLVGILSGSLGYCLRYAEDWIRRKRDIRREVLDELYEPLYRVFFMRRPFESFQEANVDELSSYLTAATTMISKTPKFADRELRNRLVSWHDMKMDRARDEMENEALWLYQHVQDHFELLRRKIGLD